VHHTKDDDGIDALPGELVCDAGRFKLTFLRQGEVLTPFWEVRYWTPVRPKKKQIADLNEKARKLCAVMIAMHHTSTRRSSCSRSCAQMSQLCFPVPLQVWLNLVTFHAHSPGLQDDASGSVPSRRRP
jgi:hypothetical protein